MSMGPEAARAVLGRAELLHAPPAVEAALDAMAGAITHRAGDADPILMCIMNGGLVPSGLLLPRLHFPLRLDYLHATRYRGRTSGDHLEWKKHHELPLNGETVLVVDDILDEGHTLQAILDYCHAQGAARVLSVVLVEKRRRRSVTLQPDVVGLEVPDRYVFGYGMDYRGYWRNAPGIFAAAAEDA